MVSGSWRDTYSEEAEDIMSLADTALEKGHARVWGKSTLTLGELISFLIGIVIIWKKPFGEKSLPVGLAVIFIGECVC